MMNSNPNQRKRVVIHLLVMFFLGVSLTASAREGSSVSLNFKNARVETVLKSISKQVGMDFVYSEQIVNVDRRVSIKVRGASLKTALQQLFKGTQVDFEVLNGKIYLEARKRESGEMPSPKPKSKPVPQTINVRGTVHDNSGEPIIGATVRMIGGSTAAITDMDGAFTIDVPADAQLEVSYIGFTTQRLSVKGRKSMAVTLLEDKKLLDEVVVVGYGSMKKSDLTGAVTVVGGQELASRQTTNLSLALQGAASGVTVTRTGGDPETVGSIRIRGITTISNADPLVIVDGVPGKLDLVNPDDVESLTVLKDAASASIYGARAAAGVIVITTKRAKSGVLDINYSYERTYEIPTELPDYVGARDYMLMANELKYNDNPSAGWWQAYTEDVVSNYARLNELYPDEYPNQDWSKAATKSHSTRQTHSVTLTGGNKTVRTLASFRYDTSDALYVNKNFRRYMIRVNNDVDINKYLSGHLDVNFKRSKSVAPVDAPWNSRRTPSIYAVKWSDGRWGDVKDGGNVLPRLYDGGSHTFWYNQLSGKAALDIKPLTGLKLSAVVAANYYFNKFKTMVKAVYYTKYAYPDDPKPMGGHNTTSLSEQRNDGYDLTYQLFANYDKQWGQHSLSAMVGYESYYNFSETESAGSDHLALTSFPYLDRGNSTYLSVGGNADQNAYRSFFGRLAYNYAGRYLVQANVRRDGSSRFAPGHRWGTFPSASVGYVISEEPWFKRLGCHWLSRLKLRASYGTLGNEQIGTNFPYQALLTIGETLLYTANGKQTLGTAAQYDYAVRDITWETTHTWDVGLEAAALDNRLWFNADIYQKNTRNMLMNLTIPRYIGFSNPKVNAGTMRTRGFDLELGWRDHAGAVGYSVSANLSDFISKITYLRGQDISSSAEKVNIEGSEFQEWYGYLSDGLFQTKEELAASPKTSDNVQVGDIKYKDISGPDGKPDGKISPEYDRVPLGGSLPRYTFGLHLTLDYKGFDLAATVQGVAKQNARISRAMVEPLADNWLNDPSILVGNYWSELNTDRENADVRYPRLSAKSADNNYAMSDYWLFNGRYLRMKNIILGYTLKAAWLKAASISKIRLYVSANDLFCLNGYPKGWDPETGGVGYPITMSLMVGASVEF
jgi:TonB-linked SusC/RagA family outer membrane protein